MGLRAFLLLALLGYIQCKENMDPEFILFKLIFNYKTSARTVLNQSCQQIRSFVDGHNSRRLQLAKGHVPGQPASVEMKSMIWDAEIAAKAAKYASVLRREHNPDSSLGSGRFRTGENLYWFSTTDHSHKLDPDNALDSWFKEYKDYTYGPLKISDFMSSKQIGHYTQMAWSDSTHLGCAISQWSQDNWNKFFVVCNYGPGGNYLDQTPYKNGTASGRLICGTGDCSRPYGDRC